jgi:hypothetical protein
MLTRVVRDAYCEFGMSYTSLNLSDDQVVILIKGLLTTYLSFILRVQIRYKYTKIAFNDCNEVYANFVRN